MAAGPSIDVFEYLDYRTYLRDYYVQQKQRGRGFSHRAFSRRAGLGSPNHLKRVMDGDRNLTTEMGARFARAMGLQNDAADYFVQLVRLARARTTSERNVAYEKLSSFKAYRRVRKLDLAHAAYHSTWYYPVIRNLAGREDFSDDPKWIAQQLLPPIKPSEAKEALAKLFDMELLQRNDKGKVVQCEPLVTTGPEVHALHIANYHRAMMQCAAEAIDLVPPDRRDISAVQVLTSEAGIRKLKTMIQRFRRELLELAVAEKGGTQVVQLNLQLFPMTAEEPEAGRKEKP